jgi:hypothetical protein
MKRLEDIDIKLARKPLVTMETKNTAIMMKPCLRVKPMGQLQPETVHAKLLKKLKLK